MKVAFVLAVLSVVQAIGSARKPRAGFAPTRDYLDSPDDYFPEPVVSDYPNWDDPPPFDDFYDEFDPAELEYIDESELPKRDPVDHARTPIEIGKAYGFDFGRAFLDREKDIGRRRAHSKPKR